MDVFSGFVELSFPPLNKCAVCVGFSALSVKHHRKKQTHTIINTVMKESRWINGDLKKEQKKNVNKVWLGPPWFNYCFSFTLAYSRISHEYSSLFIIVINLIFMF